MTPAIRKAVFPVAGLGTRFLPATKASPKEMLPVVDKPLIQYAVEEAISAGITEMIFITSSNKRAIEDHFDKSFELEYELERRGRTELLAEVRDILPKGVSCVYIRQPEALGLGHAVLCAKDIIHDEPFAVILADDLIHDSKRGCLAQMAALYEQHQCSLLAVEEIARQDTGKYGIVASEAWQGTLRRVTGIVEKPQPQNAPSTLAVVGRYILTPRIFDMIGAKAETARGEIQLTDAIAALLEHETVLAYPFIGKRYDCGSKLGYLQATVEYALRHPELGKPFQSYLDEHHARADSTP